MRLEVLSVILDDLIAGYQPSDPREVAITDQAAAEVRRQMVALDMSPDHYPTLRAMIGALKLLAPLAPLDARGRGLLASLAVLAQQARDWQPDGEQ
jgi:hypothetical protein